MTPEQVQLVRLSFAKVMNVKLEAARVFYERLFAIAPEVRPLFKGDMDAQARKLMDTLALAIGSSRNMPALSTMLVGLAERHSRYGVRDKHYDDVGAALLWALERTLGEDFTPEVKSAWTSLYDVIATRMKAAARPTMASA